MAKVKVSEATPLQLDWLVAKAMYGDRLVHYRTWLETVNAHWKGRDCSFAGVSEFRILSADFDGVTTAPIKCYSTDWAQGGPIIEREGIQLNHWDWFDEGWWVAKHLRYASDVGINGYGPTPLIAAMRCYVASKLGDEVEVPDELI